MTLWSLMNLYVFVAGKRNTCFRTPVLLSQHAIASVERLTTRKCEKRFAIKVNTLCDNAAKEKSLFFSERNATVWKTHTRHNIMFAAAYVWV